MTLTPILILLTLCSCEKASHDTYRQQLEQYHAESQSLPQATPDSLVRFNQKVVDFTRVYPQVTDEPVYHAIQQNINAAYLTVRIISPQWGDDVTWAFGFGDDEANNGSVQVDTAWAGKTHIEY